jgi:PAS domain S-box-containing protein
MEIASLPTSSRSPVESIDRYPLTVAPETLLVDAIALMSQTRNACPLPNSQPLADSQERAKTSIGCVLVIENDRLVGLLSERDVVNLTAAEFCWQGVKVAEVMTRNLIVLKESEFVDVFTALNLFCQHSIDYLPIVDDRDRLVGLVTPHSIRQEVAKLQQKQRELLDSNSELEKQARDLTAQLQQQLKCVSESDRRNRLIAQIASRIRTTLNIEDLVNSTVAEVRQFLECDRVLVCQFARDKSGNIVAESVAPGWTKTLGNQVEDACFYNREKEQYFQTGKWVCPDISKAGLTDCHLQVLESYQVKANLAVPISIVTDKQNSPSLWGLLLAHQCSETRRWQESELELLDQLAVQIAIALQQGQLLDRTQAELAQRSSAEAALRDRSEQLINAENALQTSRTQLSDIINSVTASISSCRVFANRDWENNYFSRGHEQIFGYTSEELMADKQLWMSRVVPEDLENIIFPIYANIFAERTVSLEYRFCHKNGDVRWIAATLSSRRDTMADSWIVTCVATDISDRKNAENALRQSEARYRAIIEDQTELICRYLPDGKMTFVNQAYCRYFGVEQEDLIGNSFMPLIPEADRSLIEEQYASLSPDKPFFTCEHRVILPNGDIRWQQWTDRAIFDETGNIVEYQAVGRDVSDRKLAEIALQQLNAELEQRAQQRAERYEMAVSAGKVVVWDWNLETEEIYVDPFLKTWLGYQECEIGSSSTDWGTLVHPDDLAGINATVNAHLEGRTADFEVEHRMLCKDGSIRWMYARGSALRDEGDKPYRVTGTGTDITDRKRVEAALQKSEEQFRDLFDDAPIALSLASVRDLRIIKVNEAHRQMLGYSDSELAAATFTDLTHPEDIEADLDQFQDLVEGNISRFGMEKRLIKKNGDLVWTNLTVTLIRDLDGTPLYSMGAIEDISYRKRAELELQQLKERLQLLLASNPAVIFTLQPAGDFATTYISDNVKAIVGYSSEECLADPHFWSSRIHPEDLKQFLVGFTNLSGPENRTCEYRFLHRDGLYRWLRTELKLLVNSKGEPIEIIGYAADISNSKCAEIALRQQFEQEQLVESIARRVRQSLELAEILNTTVAELQHILAVDRVMVYQLLPDGGGKVIAEAVADGCSHILDRVFAREVFSPENYQHYFAGQICAISERNERDVTPCLVNFITEIEVRAELVAPIVQLNQLWGLLIAHQCDRTRDWQEWEINLFQQLANQLAIAIQQSLLYQQVQSELNERKQAEENLTNSLKEKEILLKEIHHRVKNNLCVVASLLELQSNTVADSQLAKMLAESQHRLYSMALIHEKLYRSKNLRQINLGEYIEDLVTNLFHSYNINDNRIQLQVFAEPILLNIETATPCGLIVNELVSNTLKHAFPNGTSGTVSVECYQTGDREIHLFVKDNGTGFPKNLDFRKTGSMGFQVICTLTDQLDGTIELSREIGTVFHLKFNELKYFSRL